MSWTLIILLLWFVIIVYYYGFVHDDYTERFQNNPPQFLSPSVAQEYLKNLPEFNSYLLKVPKSQYTFKTNGTLNETNSVQQFRDYYLSKIKPWLNNELRIIRQSLIALATRTGQFGKIWTQPWRFIKIDPDLEGGMPFTFGNTILLPETIIKNSNFFLETLFHEKIHVLQKADPAGWSARIQEKLPWMEKIPEDQLPFGFRESYLMNPDGTDINWLYNIDGKKYIPYLSFDKGNVGSKIWNCRHIDDNFRRKIKIKESWYHPNEFLATSIASIVFYPKDYELNFVLLDFESLLK